jgi:hypothetical protein
VDLLPLFGSLHTGQLEFFCLNFGEIVLLPIVNDDKGYNNIDLAAFLMLLPSG